MLRDPPSERAAVTQRAIIALFVFVGIAVETLQILVANVKTQINRARDFQSDTDAMHHIAERRWNQHIFRAIPLQRLVVAIAEAPVLRLPITGKRVIRADLIGQLLELEVRIRGQ